MPREFATVAAVSIGLHFLAAEASRAQDKPAAPAKSGVSAKLDAAKGFMGQDFGTEFSTFTGLESYEERGPLKLYTKEGDLALLGPVKVSEVIYYFYEDKFYGIALHTDDGQDGTNLLRILQAAYGYGTQGSPEVPSYYWPGRTVSARFEINPSTGEGNAFIYDNKLDHDFTEYEEKASQEAAAKL